MSARRLPAYRSWAAAAIVGLAHFAAAWASLALTRWSNGLASVWLPNAILLAYLLLTHRRRWPAACAAVFVSGTVANWAGGAPFELALLFGATNAGEPLIVLAMLRAGQMPADIERLSDLMRFVLGTVLACALSATLAAGAMSYALGAQFSYAWMSWFVSAGLGLLIATPILLIGYRHWRLRSVDRRFIAEGAAALALVFAVSVVAFGQNSLPLSFILQPPVLFATFRMRALGAASSALIVACVGTFFIMHGAGPAAFVVMPFAVRIALFQAFLGLTILTALSIAAMLAERDRFSRQLSERETQYRSLVDSVSDVIFRTDEKGRWTYLNPAWEGQTGYPVAETIGTSFLKHVIEEDRADFLERLKWLESGLFPQVRHQFRFRTASGEHRWGEAQANRIVDAEGRTIGSAGIIVDISDRLALAAMVDEARRQAEQEAEAALRLASTDELTDVASRRAFLAAFAEQLSAAKASDTPLSVALFDIDHFKRVNDRYGHATGDEVLKRVAAIARGCVRDRDVIGRLGGEEFGILMPGVSLHQAATIAERLRIACADAKTDIPVTISIGVSSAVANSTTVSLLKQADEALYRAKGEGRNCLRMAA
ncbi:diguanylate cyclase [Sphingomonas tabacisoli]|uniref:diguanylate cyclase n=1 Tax=Sphingomonas tabacisoli TaxID=2249466 RepID=A0ABW4I2Q1_9SPHN